jgi:hypothetical protein
MILPTASVLNTFLPHTIRPLTISEKVPVSLTVSTLFIADAAEVELICPNRASGAVAEPAGDALDKSLVGTLVDLYIEKPLSCPDATKPFLIEP